MLRVGVDEADLLGAPSELGQHALQRVGQQLVVGVDRQEVTGLELLERPVARGAGARVPRLAQHRHLGVVVEAGEHLDGLGVVGAVVDDDDLRRSSSVCALIEAMQASRKMPCR